MSRLSLRQVSNGNDSQKPGSPYFSTGSGFLFFLVANFWTTVFLDSLFSLSIFPDLSSIPFSKYYLGTRRLYIFLQLFSISLPTDTHVLPWQVYRLMIKGPYYHTKHHPCPFMLLPFLFCFDRAFSEAISDATTLFKLLHPFRRKTNIMLT